MCSSIVVEEGIEEIENRAFSTCALLTKVTLPSTIKKIGNHLFDQSANLNEIEISSKNPYFSSYKECNCIVDLKTMTLIQAIGTTTIPEGVLVIASDAYYQLNVIKSITIPDSVVTLEKNCFNECSELNNLYIGKSVKDATDCFYNCFSLNDIKISDDNPYITYNINIRNFISK